MPVGTPPDAVHVSAAEAARELFEGHKYVFVVHEDQVRRTCTLRFVPIGMTACACRLERPTWIAGVQSLLGTCRTAA
jgi:hypothetical protein